MAGFSIILLMLLFLWPFALVAVAAVLAFELAALVVTSPSFPWLVAAFIAGVWGSIEGILSVWRWHKDPEDHPLSLKAFKKTFVLYGISFVTACVAVALAGIAIWTFFAET